MSKGGCVWEVAGPNMAASKLSAPLDAGSMALRTRGFGVWLSLQVAFTLGLRATPSPPADVHAQEVIIFLNFLFCQFDKLVGQYQVQKVGRGRGA